MMILLCLLKISTSQENKDKKANYTHNKTASGGEPCILNSNHSLSGTVNGFKKRFKPLDNNLDPYEVFVAFIIDFYNHKSSKTSSGCGLVTEETNYNNFVRLKPNAKISKGYTEIATKLDSFNISDANNKNDLGNIPHINIPDVQKENNLSHQQHSGILITELKKILEIRQNQSLKDQLEIMNFNKNILIGFVSNIEIIKDKKTGSISSKGPYPHNKESVICLYSYLLRAKIRSMGNLNLLNVLISETEYNNEVMIYCFLASNTNKILNFIIENFYNLDITPMFFYNVGLFMEKYYPHGCFGVRFPIVCGTGTGSRKYRALSGFIKAYRSLETHNKMNLPDIFDENFINMCEKTQLETITLYNLIREEYNQNLPQIV